MPGTTTLKFISSLKQKKNRKENNLFILEGEKLIDELFLSSFDIHSVYATDQWLKEKNVSTENGLQSLSSIVPVHKVTDRELARISSLSTPNKVLAIVNKPDYKLVTAGLHGKITLVLDNVQDPGNLGTLIRTCDWFGINNIVCSENSAEVTNPKVIQASMGSVLRVRTHYLHLPDFLSLPDIKGIPVYGAFTGGPDIYSSSLADSGIIVLGNESRGISDEIKPFISNIISIPGKSDRSSSPESLNIAVAGSIIISEFRRRFSDKWQAGK
ncbi:MAG: TrmH family RNA methyltransferase [Bacteroidales bacterium]